MAAPRSPAPTAALVLETNNLLGGDLAAVVTAMKRLLLHLGAQTRALASLAEVVVTHDGLPEAARSRLERAAGVPLRFVEVAPFTGYYEAKNLGFDATTADVVAFGDGDCWPEPEWLERLLAPFDDARVEAVAGRTTYREDLLGQAVSAIDFMYFAPPGDRGATRNFYANNVAFRREVFGARRYAPVRGQFRGACQVLGLRLEREGVRVRFEPGARTTHRFPDSLRELVQLRLYRGADTPKLVPFLVDAHAPRALAWLGRLEPLASLGVLAARLGFSARSVGRQDMRALDLPRRAACLGLMAAVSGLDTIGALARATGVTSFGLDAAGHAETLSYHGNGDGLTSDEGQRPEPARAGSPAAAA